LTDLNAVEIGESNVINMTTKNSTRQSAIQAAVLAAGTPSLEAIAKIAEIFSRVGSAL